jgi:SAM-dependent methyltransferase
MATLKEIASHIRDICYDVDLNITGLPESEASAWSEDNSIRHAHTIMAIMTYSQDANKKKLKILNASGMACGHQDFSIISYLIKNTDIKPDWVAFDSPLNEHLKKERFNKYKKDLKVDLKLMDFTLAGADGLFGEESGVYDIVLFTEIAEHLDHTVFLNSLEAIHRVMSEDGILILTTPNLVSLPNRFRILFGNGDGLYNGDGVEDKNNRIYGHITLYDTRRLKRLLAGAGFETARSYTFTFGHGPDGKTVTTKLNDIVSVLFKNSRTNIFIIGHKSKTDRKPSVK